MISSRHLGYIVIVFSSLDMRYTRRRGPRWGTFIRLVGKVGLDIDGCDALEGTRESMLKWILTPANPIDF